jgi:putative ABC transport system permease protein
MEMLTRASLRFYAATHVMVVLGVAVAVAVLAGALLVGASVRESLKQIALGRLGATDVIVTSPTFFRTALSDSLLTRSTQPEQSPLGARLDAYRVLRSTAPVVVFGGAVVHDESKRAAGKVMVYGIDERFGRFHGVDGFEVSGREALISAALAAEVGAKSGDTMTLRVAKPSDIPLSTLQGRRETTGERIRVTVARVLDEASLGEFSLSPAQGPVFAIYVPIGRLQRDLGLGDRANTILMSLNDATEIDPAKLIRELVAPVASLDDLGLRTRTVASRRSPGEPASAVTIVETRAGLLTDDLVATVEDLAARDKRMAVPALTYVANSIRIGDRAIPYSTVSAVDLDAYNRLTGNVGPEKGVGDLFRQKPGEIESGRLTTAENRPDPARPALPDPGKDPRPLFSNHAPVWLNEWAADDLQARIGDEVTLDFFLWSDADGLTTSSARFTLVGIAPMTGIGGDPTLTPDYPGISDAADMTSWDPPFPVELKRIRPHDEDYWDRYRAAPKAIISLAEGQRLWGSRYGKVSSMRLSGPTPVAAQSFPPAAAGFTARAVRGEALAAAQGTTDFGQYFLYFSFFLVVSALLLAYLFFAVGLEQRTREIGLLSAVGYAPSAIRRAFVREGAVLAGIGTLIGIAAAVGYAALIMYGLRTWWVGAVGTTRLSLHVAPQWLAIGALGALVAGVWAIWMGVRQMSRRSARSLLKGDASAPVGGSPARTRTIAIAFAILGLALLVAAASGSLNPTAGFFGAGGAWLVAGLTGASAWLRRKRPSRMLTRGLTGMSQLGFRHTVVRPSRSVLSLALIAFACFVLVSVGAFRKEPASGGDKTSGTGGFTLMAESVAPLMHDPNTPDGRDGLGLESGDPILSSARITRFRLRPGDETSCLTLYKPTNPRIIAPGPGFAGEGRFTFASSMADTPDEQANPWTLLNRTFDDGAIAAVADQTTLMYVLHLGIGDDFEFTPEGQPPVRLRIVGALADSVLQSELIIGEANFVRLFPRQEGYRMWMIDTAPANAAAVTSHLEDRLSDYGLDVTDTLERWASYHQVENTYLATFQALGSLGLLLGTVGLGAVLARNVLERRRDIGLLRAVGFTPVNVRSMVLSEGLALVLGGALLGAACAIVAVWPALQERAQAVPIGSLVALLTAVVATGVVSSLFAVRLASATPVVQAIKGE